MGNWPCGCQHPWEKVVNSGTGINVKSCRIEKSIIKVNSSNLEFSRDEQLHQVAIDSSPTGLGWRRLFHLDVLEKSIWDPSRSQNGRL